METAATRVVRRLGLDPAWQLVLLVAVPLWLAAAAFRVLGMMLAVGTAPEGFYVVPPMPRILQHVALLPFVALAYRGSLALGWPQSKRIRAALLHCLLAVAVSALARPALLLVNAPFFDYEDMSLWEHVVDRNLTAWMRSTLDFSLAYLFGLGGLVVAHTILQLRHVERERARLVGAWTAARLQSLRMQLDPHFLFNAFNLVVVMMDREPARARKVVLGLSELFRRTLASVDRPWNALGDELAYAEEYLRIQAERFGSRLAFTIEVPAALKEVRVPSMLLQPLVENAVVHGSDDDSASITVRIDASELVAGDGSRRLQLQIHNSTDASLAAGRSGRGIGLRTTMDRLDACYDGQAALRCGAQSPSRYRVELDLPIEPPPGPGSAVPLEDRAP